MANKQTSGLNRRQSVRITDRILLSYAPVSEEKYNTIAEDYSNGIALANQDGLADIQMFIGAQSALNRLRERDEDLADFLKHMDTKISTVLQRVKGEPTPFDDLKQQKANLSANGIAFDADQQLEPDLIIELNIVLLPSYAYIYCFAKVVNCELVQEQDDEKLYHVATEFVLLMDDDREKLIQHNFKQQSLALRNRRRDDES